MRRLGSVLFILVAFISSYGQNVYTATISKEPERMGGKFLYLEDPTNKLTLEDVLKSDKFKPTTADIPNFDVTGNAIWGEIKLTCTQEADWYMQGKPSVLNRITFYQKRGNNAWTEVTLGNEIEPENRPIPVSHIFLKLNIHPGDTTLLLFHVHDYYPLQFNVSVGPIESFLGEFEDMDMYNGLCFGIMVMMLIYNLYLFFTQKQKAYLYYVTYVACNTVFVLIFTGNFIYVPRFLHPLIFFDPIFFAAAFGVFLVIFTLELFKGYLTKFVKILFYGFIIAVSINAIIGITDYKILAFGIIRILGLLLGVICITAGIVAHRKGSSSARFYIAGFSAYLGGLAFLILTGHLIPTNSFAFKALLTGSMLETMLLSFAQGDKLKMFQLEKEKAQHETMLQLQENEKLIKEQNVVLEQKVKERTAELAQRNKDIIDSIHYASRIQRALLTADSYISKRLPEYFILFKPRDIVSGDFYWANEIQVYDKPRFLICAGDCTGHGVPGAFMSLLNISTLNEATNVKGIHSPAAILDEIREHTIKALHQEGTGSSTKDGMDCVLCSFDFSTLKLDFACANNPLWIIRNNELIEYKADKMPVGKQDETYIPFTLQSANLQKGDLVYIFSDGYADQFGGPKGKKYKYKQLQEVLLANADKPAKLQKEILEKTLKDWIGSLEQVDDILIIGIRV